MPAPRIEDRRLRAISLALLSYFMFTVIDTCAKWLMASGLPPTEAVFVRYAGHFILVALLFLPRHGREVVRTRSWKLELARGLCLLGSTVCNFIAITYIPLTTTSAIGFTMPLVICALSIPMLGETVGWRRWLAIGVGFVGVMIIIQPGTEAFEPAVLLSFGAVGFTAFYMLLTRKVAGLDSARTQQFYAAGVATVCLLPVAFGGWVWPQDPTTWLCFFGIGAAALISHLAISVAHRLAPASTLAPFGYIQIIFMTASSWFIFDQPPTVWIFVGAPIVIGSGLYIWLRERQLAKSVVTDVTSRD